MPPPNTTWNLSVTVQIISHLPGLGFFASFLCDAPPSLRVGITLSPSLRVGITLSPSLRVGITLSSLPGFPEVFEPPILGLASPLVSPPFILTPSTPTAGVADFVGDISETEVLSPVSLPIFPAVRSPVFRYLVTRFMTFFCERVSLKSATSQRIAYCGQHVSVIVGL